MCVVALLASSSSCWLLFGHKKTWQVQRLLQVNNVLPQVQHVMLLSQPVPDALVCSSSFA